MSHAMLLAFAVAFSCAPDVKLKATGQVTLKMIFL